MAIRGIRGKKTIRSLTYHNYYDIKDSRVRIRPNSLGDSQIMRDRPFEKTKPNLAGVISNIDHGRREHSVAMILFPRQPSENELKTNPISGSNRVIPAKAESKHVAVSGFPPSQEWRRDDLKKRTRLPRQCDNVLCGKPCEGSHHLRKVALIGDRRP